eukprot:5640665-Amphidinium_carterae.1
MLPDGFVLTVFTVLALKFGWKGIDRLNKRIEGRPGAVGAVKARFPARTYSYKSKEDYKSKKDSLAEQLIDLLTSDLEPI